MAEPSGFQKVMISVANFFRNLVQRIKKTDKRFLIMIAAAVVLLIIILALIIHGVSSRNDKKEDTSGQGAVISAEQTTDDPEPVIAAPKINGTGMYIVTTGSDSDLNMRLAADKSTNVVTTIPNNTQIEVLFVDDSEAQTPEDYGWGYVDYNGKRGWVFMEYLTPIN